MFASRKLNIFRRIIFLIFFNLCIMSLIFSFSVFYLLFHPYEQNLMQLYSNLYISVIFIFFSVVLYKIHAIIKSLNSNPFTESNIKNFRIIYRCMMIVAVLNGVVTYPLPHDSIFHLFQTQYGSLKSTCILYFVLAIVALTLSYIFEKVIEMKNENDLTV